MEDQSKIEKVYDRVEQYVLTTAELYKLKALQKALKVEDLLTFMLTHLW